jgi:S-DNA-T family DNA segregation ATPase FtsK/SpoIIIE
VEAEVVALGLVAAALLLEVALASYSPADPFWGLGQPVENLCGPVGALLAYGLAGSLGWASHGLPLAALVVALRYLRGLPVRPRWVPIAAWSVFWVSVAASLDAAQRLFPAALSAELGGSFGAATVDALKSVVYLPGTTLLLSITLLSSLLIATGGSARDTLLRAQRILRSFWRELAQRWRVGWARARMRLERYAEERAERAALAAEENEELDSELTPRRVLPRRVAASEPEVVEHRVARPTAPRQEALPFEAGALGPYKLPDLDLLAMGPDASTNFDRDALLTNSRILEKKLADFQVMGRVVKVHPGPVITMYEFEPAPGIKVSRITNLADDLALALRAMAVRIVAPIPGKSVVGIEVPNPERDVVMLRDVMSHPSYQESESRLELALGKDIFGSPVTPLPRDSPPHCGGGDQSQAGRGRAAGHRKEDGGTLRAHGRARCAEHPAVQQASRSRAGSGAPGGRRRHRSPTHALHRGRGRRAGGSDDRRLARRGGVADPPGADGSRGRDSPGPCDPTPVR